MSYSGIAIAGSNLYALITVASDVAVLHTPLATPPDGGNGDPLSGALTAPWDGDSVTALAAFAGTAYVGVTGASIEILSIDAASDTGLDQITPATVVDVTSALTGMNLRPIQGLAADDTSVVWTQAVGSTVALLKHDLSDGNTTVTVLYSATTSEDSPSQVALDGSYAYTVTAGGQLYAVSRNPGDGGNPIPLAFVSLSTPLVVANGNVFFIEAGGASGPIFAGAVGSSPNSIAYGLSVDTFAINGPYLYFGSGGQLSYAPIATLYEEPLLTAQGNSAIAGIAAGSGYVALYTQDLLELIDVEQP